MKSLDELKAIRESMQNKIAMRDVVSNDDTRVVVGMATCGIAAGARETLNEFISEIAKRNLKNVKVVQTGCIGMCKLEPLVEIINPKGEKVTYVKVDAEKARKIVNDHIVNGKIVTEFVISDKEVK